MRRIVERSLIQCAMSALLVLSAGADVFAGGNVIHVQQVVETGEPAPGLESGTLFEDFGTLEQVLLASSAPDVSPASIDDEGNVAFHVFYGTDGVPDTDIFLSPHAVYRIARGGTPQLIANIEDAAPGVREPFTGFPSGLLISPPAMIDGSLGLTGAYGENPFSPQIGAWFEIDGELMPMFLEDDHLPGMIDGASLIPPLGVEFLSGPSAVVVGAISDDLEGDVRARGMWRNQGGAIEMIMATDSPVPGLPDGIVFGESTSTQHFGPHWSFDFTTDGRIGFVGMYKGPGIGVTNDEGIFVETTRGVELVLRETDPVPDPFYLPGSFFGNEIASIGAFSVSGHINMRINDNDDVLFTAEITEPGPLAHGHSLWVTRDGELELIARGSFPFVAFDVEGTLAPGIPGGSFLSFTAGDLHNNGDIAIEGVVEIDGAFLDGKFALFVHRSDELEFIAREEGPVPTDPSTFFTAVDLIGFEDDGSVLYLGWTGFFDDTPDGLFRHNVDGNDEVVMQIGAQVLVDDDAKPRTVTKFNLGSGMTSDGLRPIGLHFTDGTSGIYLMQFGDGVSATPGDLDTDGDVDFSDLLALLAAWGACDADCPEDLDDSGDVGFADLLILLANWS